jgi:transposase
MEIVMNYWTREIAKILNIGLETALLVQAEMECSGFDFSEATDRQFKREAKLCFAVINN